jgi:hypothetical protein
MHDIHSIAALTSALQFTKSSDMPSEHKAVLIDLLTTALRDRDMQDIQNAALAKSVVAPWRDTDTAALQTFLTGKVASSWQNADEFLVQLASLLGRDLQSVRAKATELGFGAGVDFRLARALKADRARIENG